MRYPYVLISLISTAVTTTNSQLTGKACNATAINSAFTAGLTCITQQDIGYCDNNIWYNVKCANNYNCFNTTGLIQCKPAQATVAPHTITAMRVTTITSYSTVKQLCTQTSRLSSQSTTNTKSSSRIATTVFQTATQRTSATVYGRSSSTKSALTRSRTNTSPSQSHSPSITATVLLTTPTVPVAGDNNDVLGKMAKLFTGQLYVGHTESFSIFATGVMLSLIAVIRLAFVIRNIHKVYKINNI
ncbi:hypothetical protein MP228_008033 [Amoeboaphelidium protococcarum]|nr:hypothetical protein MP228_008033 [Amoeboaphelidium protococcarum]